MDIQALTDQSKKASREVCLLDSSQKNRLLRKIADELMQNTSAILEANAKDMEIGRQNNLGTKLDRLLLTEDRLSTIADDVTKVAELPDSVGQIIDERERPNGLKISRVRVPLGVIGMIYEARPNVTVDAAVLCLKSGNAVILKGGSDALHSNRALVQVIRAALEQEGLNPDAVQLIDSTDREVTKAFLQVKKGIDCIIPRGGKSLIDFVKATATIPVIETGASVVHVYVDASANLKKAVDIVVNSKTRRVSICNALDVLLVHESVAAALLPKIGVALQASATQKSHPLVEVHASKPLQALMGDYTNVAEATPDDFDTEYLDYRMAIKIVKSADEAIAHIQAHSLGHSEAIVTEDAATAETFLNKIDAACVYLNASTQFSDGGQFGLGAEIGISTQKLHVRGPFALEGLTTYKWVIRGSGQVRP